MKGRGWGKRLTCARWDLDERKATKEWDCVIEIWLGSRDPDLSVILALYLVRFLHTDLLGSADLKYSYQGNSQMSEIAGWEGRVLTCVLLY